MTAGSKRLARLHALRAQLADAAALECRRVALQQAEVESARNDLSEARSFAIMGQELPRDTWRERTAALDLISRGLATLEQRQSRLLLEQMQVRGAERNAVLAREQAKCVLKSRTEAENVLAQRREQAALDEAHALARVRLQLATRL